MPRVDPDLVEAALEEERKRFDQGQKAAMAVNVLAALVLWLVVYVVFVVITSIFFHWIWEELPHLLSLLGLACLGVVTWWSWQTEQRHRRERAAVFAGERPPDAEALPEMEGGERPAWLKVVEKSLLLPPVLTVQAIQAWQSRQPWNEQQREDAVTVLVALLQVPAWLQLQALEVDLPPKRRGEAMLGLHDMDLLRCRGDADRLEVRANPIFRSACGVSAKPGGDAGFDPTRTADQDEPGSKAYVIGAADAEVDPAHLQDDGPAPFEIGETADPLARPPADEQEPKKKSGGDSIDVDW